MKKYLLFFSIVSILALPSTTCYAASLSSTVPYTSSNENSNKLSKYIQKSISYLFRMGDNDF